MSLQEYQTEFRMLFNRCVQELDKEEYGSLCYILEVSRQVQKGFSSRAELLLYLEEQAKISCEQPQALLQLMGSQGLQREDLAVQVRKLIEKYTTLWGRQHPFCPLSGDSHTPNAATLSGVPIRPKKTPAMDRTPSSCKRCGLYIDSTAIDGPLHEYSVPGEEKGTSDLEDSGYQGHEEMSSGNPELANKFLQYASLDETWKQTRDAMLGRFFRQMALEPATPQRRQGSDGNRRSSGYNSMVLRDSMLGSMQEEGARSTPTPQQESCPPERITTKYDHQTEKEKEWPTSKQCLASKSDVIYAPTTTKRQIIQRMELPLDDIRKDIACSRTPRVYQSPAFSCTKDSPPFELRFYPNSYKPGYSVLHVYSDTSKMSALLAILPLEIRVSIYDSTVVEADFTSVRSCLHYDQVTLDRHSLFSTSESQCYIATFPQVVSHEQLQTLIGEAVIIQVAVQFADKTH